MDNTLMDLIETGTVVKFDREVYEKHKRTMELLKETGFARQMKDHGPMLSANVMMKLTIHKYIKITQEKIDRFMAKKNGVEFRPREVKVPPRQGGLSMASVNALLNQQSNDRFRQMLAMDQMNSRPTRGIQYEWRECAIKDYSGIPPLEVLETLKVHKDREIFDEFTVASVTEVKDPIIFGRFNGVKARFYIAQWGDDVCLDDLI